MFATKATQEAQPLKNDQTAMEAVKLKGSTMMQTQPNEVYPDNFTEYLSLCRSALNGVITPRTSKQEKIDYAFKALKILSAIEAEYNGLTPNTDFNLTQPAASQVKS